MHRRNNPPQRRDHRDFLLRLKDLLPSRGQLLEDVEAAVAGEGLRLEDSSWEEAAAALGGEYLRQNRIVDVAAALAQQREEERGAEAAAAAAAAAVGG
jgi:hypothetical protein